jgi:hypothetical protein
LTGPDLKRGLKITKTKERKRGKTNKSIILGLGFADFAGLLGPQNSQP